MKCRVYVDGFNLYYGALRKSKFKWLNLDELSKSLLSVQSVEKIKFFAARVSGAVDPDAPKRQKLYLDALSSLPNFEFISGRFSAKPKWLPLIQLPIGNLQLNTRPPTTFPLGLHDVQGSRGFIKKLRISGSGNKSKYALPQEPVMVQVKKQEEKGSDVNLGTHLLNDAWKNKFDRALVITNDTDLETPITMVTGELGKHVTIVCPDLSPPFYGKPIKALEDAATDYVRLRKRHLRDAQLPNSVTLNGRNISKPASW